MLRGWSKGVYAEWVGNYKEVDTAQKKIDEANLKVINLDGTQSGPIVEKERLLSSVSAKEREEKAYFSIDDRAAKDPARPDPVV